MFGEYEDDPLWEDILEIVSRTKKEAKRMPKKSGYGDKSKPKPKK